MAERAALVWVVAPVPQVVVDVHDPGNGAERPQQGDGANHAEQYRGDHAAWQLETLGRVAGSHGVGPNTVVYAWMMQNGVIPLMAASRPEHMRDNLKSLDLVLSDEEMSQLNTVQPLEEGAS